MELCSIHEGKELPVGCPYCKLELQADDVQFLRALEAAGVDNWDGYEEAQEYFNAAKYGS